jgi:hypothetical protein
LHTSTAQQQLQRQLACLVSHFLSQPNTYIDFSYGLRVSVFAQVRYLPAMDFLKSAVASAIAKGLAFPYAFGDIVDVDQSIWTLYNGTKRVRT